MSRDSLSWLSALDVEYARFNAEKSVATSDRSLFSVVEVGPLTVTTDRAREATYYNRIIGCSLTTLPWLDRALELFDGWAFAPRIDVDIQEIQSLELSLQRRGFVSRQQLIWLISGSSPKIPSTQVIRLKPDDVNRILPLLEFEGPIDRGVWALRRQHHCSARFRIFVVEVEQELVALATTFVGKHGAVLGNAFTRPEFRGRGYQAALIAARLADAEELGLDCVTTDVEPQTTSLRNCERAGFKTLRHQSVWERTPVDKNKFE
ncbi:GNAT family N-acetyltransferase [candidate division CSSED10-310 bacterium]|uniref:GNAT family N-acetyltransferase n=1 Tax=candidate division CSSED10-310 bacterium TaxID=2855610 RepID=A0ABV6Z4Q0_UNCC1